MMKDDVVIFSGSNDYYMPYLAVMLQSVIHHINHQRNYKIILLEMNNSEDIKEKIKMMSNGIPNVSIHFAKIPREIMAYSETWNVGKWSKELYITLLAPFILDKYEKAIYMDADVVNLHDLADLYDIELGEHLVGASRLLGRCIRYGNGFYQIQVDEWEKDQEIEQFTGYFNNGIMLLNLQSFRKSYTVHDVCSVIEKKKFQLLDQDCMNYLCKDKILYIDAGWNWYPYSSEELENLKKLCADWMKEYFFGKEIKNIHFTIPIKPWLEPFGTYMWAAIYFWKYVQGTPFDYIIKKRMEEYQERKTILSYYTSRGEHDLQRECKTKRVFLYGAGYQGNLCVCALKGKYSIEGIIDIDSLKWGGRIDNIPIISKQDIPKNSNEVVIIITNEDYDDVLMDLYRSGYHNLFLYSCISRNTLWPWPSEFVDISRAMDMLYDSDSKETFLQIIKKRNSYRFNKNIKYSDLITGNMYFSSGLLKINEEEVYLDIGYDTECVTRLYRKFVAERYNKIVSLLDYDKKRDLRNLLNLNCTFIRMNCYGTMELLKHIKEMIVYNKPKMAICVSNERQDLWHVILYINAIVPEYRLYVRHHDTYDGSTVVYATL